jgi:hypothetical protein
MVVISTRHNQVIILHSTLDIRYIDSFNNIGGHTLTLLEFLDRVSSHCCRCQVVAIGANLHRIDGLVHQRNSIFSAHFFSILLVQILMYSIRYSVMILLFV